MCQGHVTSKSAVDAWALSLPIPPCASRLALWSALRSDILMKPVEFVVHSSSLTLTVSLDVQMVLMCLLHTSPYQVNCPGPLPHKIIELVYFKQRGSDIPQERWVKNIPYVSLALHGGSVILFAQQLVYHHLSGEWCCVILLVEHTNCEGPSTSHLLSLIHRACWPR